MDEIFNLLHSPAFWFGSAASVIFSIIANRIDKHLPGLSMAWVTAIIWFYGASALLITAHAAAVGYPSLFALPNANLSPVVWITTYFPTLLFTGVVPVTVEYLSIVAPERTFMTSKLLFGTLILICFGVVLYQIVLHRGWTGEVFNIYQVLTFLVAGVGALGAAVIAFTFWVAGIISSFLKRASRRLTVR